MAIGKRQYSQSVYSKTTNLIMRKMLFYDQSYGNETELLSK